MRFIIGPEEDGMLLSAALARHVEGVPRWALRAAFRAKDVKVDGRRAGEGDRVHEGQEVRAFFPKEALRRPALPQELVCYEDGRLLIVNKPQGLACVSGDPAGDTVLTRAAALLRERGESDALLPCHRLDVNTGGLLILARDREAQEAVREAIGRHEIEKTYTCLVKGCPARREAVLRSWLRKDAVASRVSVFDSPAHGAEAIETRYRVLSEGEVSRLEVGLVTGRTHQIRAHLAHIGHPILGDDKYGDRQLNRRMGVTRQRLWATRLRFAMTDGPLAALGGTEVTAEAPF